MALLDAQQDHHSMQQDDAFHLLKTGKNIFLTGAAGAGKTYLLNKYIHYLKEHQVTVAITASTGIAATHLQGMTIHAWSGMGVKEALTQHDLEKLLTKNRIKRNYKKTKVLIIDEISMLHKHQLDMVDTIARFMRNSKDSFGGLQVVLCGDFFQLPPVSSAHHQKEIAFAFESDAWETGDFQVCYLEEQHRQQNDLLLTVLNDIRSGTAGEHTKVPLRTRYKKEPEGDVKATKLYSRNINVDAINAKALSELPGKAAIFRMKTDGFVKLVENLKKSNLAMETLALKINAEVMFIKNDPHFQYVNGTRGKVIGFDCDTGWPIVKTYHNETITAYEVAWEYEENGVIRASITQVPLRLAWAITIHKSQGMTLDAAEIDLGDAFEPGMGYVALSRVRSFSGLKLMNLNEMALKVHPTILEQDKIFKRLSENVAIDLKKLPENTLTLFQQKTLLERFSGSLEKNIPEKNARAKKIKMPTHFITLDFLKEKLSLADIAKKRALTEGTIIAHIEKLKGLKKINHDTLLHIKEAIPTKDFEIVLSELKKSTDGWLAPIYENFKEKYSYPMLRVVRLFVGLE